MLLYGVCCVLCYGVDEEGRNMWGGLFCCCCWLGGVEFVVVGFG